MRWSTCILMENIAWIYLHIHHSSSISYIKGKKIKKMRSMERLGQWKKKRELRVLLKKMNASA